MDRLGTMIPTLRFAYLIGFALMVAGSAATAAEEATVGRSTIVFVCQHGSVKSVVAAAHFNRIARERGLPFTAVARGIEVDKAIPGAVRGNLARDGLAPDDDTPRSLTAEEADAAGQVIAFDRVPDDLRGHAAVTYWSNVPPVTKEYGAARDVIVGHLREAADALGAER